MRFRSSAASRSLNLPEDDDAVPMKRTCGAFLVLAIVSGMGGLYQVHLPARRAARKSSAR